MHEGSPAEDGAQGHAVRWHAHVLGRLQADRPGVTAGRLALQRHAPSFASLRRLLSKNTCAFAAASIEPRQVTVWVGIRVQMRTGFVATALIHGPCLCGVGTWSAAARAT